MEGGIDIKTMEPAGAGPGGAPAAEPPPPARKGASPADFLDPLLQAARFFGRRASKNSLTRGLVLDQGKLTEAGLAEAAARAHLIVETCPKRPDQLAPTEFPVIVALGDGTAETLLRRDGDGYIVGRSRKDHTRLPARELARRKPVSVRYIRPRFFFDHRSLHYDLPRNKRWLFGPLFENSWIYGYAALAGLVINLAAIAISMFSMAVYDRVIPNNSMGSLMGLLIGVLIILAADFFLKFIRGYLIDVVGRRFDIRVGSRIFAQIFAIQAKSRPQSSGALANLVREFDSVRDFFTSATLIVLADLPFVLVFLAVIWWIGGPLAYVTLAGMGISLLAAIVLQWPLKRAIARSFRESSQKAAFLHEAAVGIDTLKTANAESWARRQWEHLLAQTADTGMSTRRLSMGFTTITGTASSLTTVAVVSVGAFLVAAGDLTSGGIVAAVILSSRCMAPFAQIIGLISRWQQTRLAIGALDRLMKAETEEGTDPAALLQRFPIDGNVSFSRVSFAYPAPEGVMAPNAPALADISFDIKKGESVGIIGRVGSGKSTLLKLLVRLADPDAGNVKIDGVDARQIHPAELRAQIGYVGQDAMLFHGTIRDNIVIGKPDASDEEILAAARVAGLGEVLSHTALGLGAPAGERGALLSGGQRQAVALARAFVADPPVLLLDEPTAMMDNTTEAHFLSALAEARKGRTLITVTHKPQVLALATRVIVLEAGKLAADGPREEIIARLSGKPAATPRRKPANSDTGRRPS